MTSKNLQYPSDIDVEVENVVQISIFNRPKSNVENIQLYDIFLLSPAVINSSIAATYENKQLGGNQLINKAVNVGDNVSNLIETTLKGSNFSAEELTSFENRRMASPNLRVLYRGTPLGNHSFTFEFTPESEEDSTILLEIYNTLREASLSENIGQDITFPYEIDLKFWFKGEENKFIPKTKLSVITRITSNFQSENILLYNDGSPITRIINFELTETIALRRSDIGKGF